MSPNILKAEVQYQKEDGTWVHSDIEPHGGCKFDDLDDKHRDFLHRCLDEWINNSRGTGYFYIMNERYDIDDSQPVSLLSLINTAKAVIQSRESNDPIEFTNVLIDALKKDVKDIEEDIGEFVVSA